MMKTGKVKSSWRFILNCLHKIVTICSLIILFFTEEDTKDTDDNNKDIIGLMMSHQTSMMITKKI